jgi:hypothetical protein
VEGGAAVTGYRRPARPGVARIAAAAVWVWLKSALESAPPETVPGTVFAYLGCYDHDRLHSTLSSRTPPETRISYRQPIALAA